jgi:hypothetical protein
VETSFSAQQLSRRFGTFTQTMKRLMDYED